jgi:hypothetical protein
MLRFSDRLVSAPSTSSEQVIGVNGSSDETPTATNGESTDYEYSTLVELLGLHQTVKALEAEYCKITGVNIELSKDGYVSNSHLY